MWFIFSYSCFFVSRFGLVAGSISRVGIRRLAVRSEARRLTPDTGGGTCNGSEKWVNRKRHGYVCAKKKTVD